MKYYDGLVDWCRVRLIVENYATIHNSTRSLTKQWVDAGKLYLQYEGYIHPFVCSLSGNTGKVHIRRYTDSKRGGVNFYACLTSGIHFEPSELEILGMA